MGTGAGGGWLESQRPCQSNSLLHTLCSDRGSICPSPHQSSWAVSLLILCYVAGYTKDIPTALGNYCFLLPGSLSPVRLPRRIKSLDTLLKASDLNFVPLVPSPGS